MKEKRKRQITLIIIISLVLAFFFSGFSLGKEMSKIKINSDNEIARPILEIENSEKLNINNQNREGIYEFKIKNHNETGEITQVDLEYYIEILSPENEAISFKLYKEDKEVELENNKTENILLSKDSKQEDIYKLEIKYNEEKNVQMEDIFQEIQIKVHSEQRKV